MKIQLKASIAAGVIALFSVSASSLAIAHSGGLNEDGCHNNRKLEVYHCHQGSKSGSSSASGQSNSAAKKKRTKTVPKEGSSPQVKQVERLLKKFGYAPGRIDGVEDASLTKAIKKFQKEHKLKVTGKVSNRLITSIEKRIDDSKTKKTSDSKSTSSSSTKTKPSADVKKIETLLKKLGYSPGKVDGVENATLTKAIKKFQKDFKLKVTGKTSKTLIKSLEKRVKEAGSSTKTTTKKKTTSATKPKADANVKKVETLLKKLGYSPGRVDGIENATHTTAIRKFQKDNKLKVTGKVSKRLITSLEKRLK